MEESFSFGRIDWTSNLRARVSKAHDDLAWAGAALPIGEDLASLHRLHEAQFRKLGYWELSQESWNEGRVIGFLRELRRTHKDHTSLQPLFRDWLARSGLAAALRIVHELVPETSEAPGGLWVFEWEKDLRQLLRNRSSSERLELKQMATALREHSTSAQRALLAGVFGDETWVKEDLVGFPPTQSLPIRVSSYASLLCASESSQLRSFFRTASPLELRLVHHSLHIQVAKPKRTLVLLDAKLGPEVLVRYLECSVGHWVLEDLAGIPFVRDCEQLIVLVVSEFSARAEEKVLARGDLRVPMLRCLSSNFTLTQRVIDLSRPDWKWFDAMRKLGALVNKSVELGLATKPERQVVELLRSMSLASESKENKARNKASRPA